MKVEVVTPNDVDGIVLRLEVDGRDARLLSATAIGIAAGKVVEAILDAESWGQIHRCPTCLESCSSCERLQQVAKDYRP